MPLNLTPANVRLFLSRAKPFFLVWLVIRLFSSGFLGKTATAAAAAGLAFVCKTMPSVVPARAAEQLRRIDALSASSNQRLLLSLGVDAVGCVVVFVLRFAEKRVGDDETNERKTHRSKKKKLHQGPSWRSSSRAGSA